MRARLLTPALAALAGFTAFGSTCASAQTVQFLAVLAGGSETQAADNNGQGVATVMFGASGELCFSILTRGIAAPTAAHIHEGAAHVAGPVRVTLTTPTAGGIPGAFTSVGCLSELNTTVLARLRATPTNFYINVHNGAFPNGAVRGQLF